MNSRTLLVISGIVGAAGIAIGAFGAHALPGMLADLTEAEIQQRSDWLETGSRYHMYHAAALLAVAVAAAGRSRRFLVAPVAWLVGIVSFSGCLYAMALTGVRVLGAVVPIGGVAFIVGWLSIATSAWRKPETTDCVEGKDA